FGREVRAAILAAAISSGGRPAADLEARDREPGRRGGQPRRARDPGETGRIEESVEPPCLGPALLASGSAAAALSARRGGLGQRQGRDSPGSQDASALAGPGGPARVGLPRLEAVLLVRAADDREEAPETRPDFVEKLRLARAEVVALLSLAVLRRDRVVE